MTKAEDLRRLLAAGPPAPAIFFALPPAVTVACCEALRSVELPDGTVLALEKPFGTDADSADALNRLVSELVDEDHVQRVDHFLGRSTVLNVLGVRFANRLFEPLWSNQHIESVTIVYDEQLDAGEPGPLLRPGRRHGRHDPEPPAAGDGPDRHGAAGVGERGGPPRGEDGGAARVPTLAGRSRHRTSRRARYTAGTIEGRQVPDYVDEPGVDPARDTETLAEVDLAIDNWRWSGVPVSAAVRQGPEETSARRS